GAALQPAAGHEGGPLRAGGNEKQRSSCYWISSVTASWNNAQRDCERKQGHLVTINSPEEKVFVNQRKKPRHTWIGLTDVSGIWKWSDGTLYSFDRA
uniref:C-type lectin domain-containing protein n=1 Tax=Varanus komodoensis TaxID=61221 RepID=A0A8D2LD30_VARKO